MIRIGNNNAEILPTTIQAETSQHDATKHQEVVCSQKSCPFFCPLPYSIARFFRLI